MTDGDGDAGPWAGAARLGKPGSEGGGGCVCVCVCVWVGGWGADEMGQEEGVGGGGLDEEVLGARYCIVHVLATQ